MPVKEASNDQLDTDHATFARCYQNIGFGREPRQSKKYLRVKIFFNNTQVKCNKLLFVILFYYFVTCYAVWL